MAQGVSDYYLREGREFSENEDVVKYTIVKFQYSRSSSKYRKSDIMY